MRQYKEFYEMIGLTGSFLDCAIGDIKIPILDFDQNCYAYYFPPAFIPLWRYPDGNDYIGIWKHWFGINREITFVIISMELGCEVREIVRTFEQLIYHLLQIQITIAEGVDKEIQEFGEFFGIKNFESIEAIVDEWGEDEKGLIHLSPFKQNTPLPVCIDTHLYKGDFPNDNMDLSCQKLLNISSLELNEDVSLKISALEVIPPWLNSTNQLKIFETFLNEKNFRSAWLSINSKGWTFEQLLGAVERLSMVSNDEAFRKLCELWLSCPHPINDGY